MLPCLRLENKYNTLILFLIWGAKGKNHVHFQEKQQKVVVSNPPDDAPASSAAAAAPAAPAAPLDALQYILH